MIPNFKAVLTASPRLVESSFLNMLRRCDSTEGAARPSSRASLFVVSPLAMPRSTCISRDVRAIVLARDKGVCVATRRSTSGIIFRGTGLSLRTAASRARWSSLGPESLRTYPEQPACIILKRSSLDSDTVHAMTFKYGYLAKSRRVLAAPSSSGMWTSIKTRSALSVPTDSSASAPDEASPQNRRPAVVPSIVRAATRGRTLSSTTSTRNVLRLAGASGMRRSLPRRKCAEP
jgi:hypothetical protein